MTAHWTLFCDHPGCTKRLTLSRATGEPFQLTETVEHAEISFGWASLKTASPHWMHLCPDHLPGGPSND